jgi:hypothetical protein
LKVLLKDLSLTGEVEEPSIEVIEGVAGLHIQFPIFAPSFIHSVRVLVYTGQVPDHFVRCLEGLGCIVAIPRLEVLQRAPTGTAKDIGHLGPL